MECGRQGELHYVTLDWKVMAVEVTTTPAFQAQSPKLLFQSPSTSRLPPTGNTHIGRQAFFFSSPRRSGLGRLRAPFTAGAELGNGTEEMMASLWQAPRSGKRRR